MNDPKTLVSYQGGSGGDMITASLNNLSILMDSEGCVINKDFNLKVFEPFCDHTALIKISQSKPFDYLSIHELALLNRYHGKVINLIVTDPEVRQTIVFRQMYLQHLRIKVDDNSDWFQIVKTYCKKDKFFSAARYWFTRAESIWNRDMDFRLSTRRNHIQNVSINTLFSRNFMSEFVKQLDVPNIDRLYNNHKIWLDKNYQKKWYLNSTLKSMCQKLEKMDWDQESGIIYFKNARTT